MNTSVELHTTRDAVEQAGTRAVAEELISALQDDADARQFLDDVASREIEARRLLDELTGSEAPPEGHSWVGEYRLDVDGTLSLVDVEAVPIPGYAPPGERVAPASIVVDGEELEMSVEVGGRGVDVTAPPRQCLHAIWHDQVTIAEIHVNPDGTGPLLGRQVKVKLRCGECGVPAEFKFDTAGPSRVDGSFGLVASFEPTEE